MNKFFLLCFASLCLVYQASFAVPVKIDEIRAPITSVKVYLDAAMISHTQKVKIKPGNNKFAFFGLASNINAEHVSLRNIGAAELVSLSLIKIEDTTDVISLNAEVLEIIRKSKDSVLTMERNLKRLQYEIESLQMEKVMLENNNSIVSNTRQISVSELKQATEFYRDRYKAINTELDMKEKEHLQMKRNKIKLLNEIFSVENKSAANMNISIVVAEIINAGAEYSTEINLSYLAQEAGWIPVYNIYASNNTNLKIDYRAKILNNTGIDWENLKITLSTADPFQYYSAPDLEPFYFSEYNRYRENNYNMSNNMAAQVQQQQLKIANKIQAEEIYVPEKEITFTIAKPYTYFSGFVPKFIDVTSYQLSPDFQYRCAPKKEEQVYAIAKISDWEKLNLIDGEANIYNNDIFLGKSYIRASEIEEHLELPLGVVDNIYVKRKLVSEYSSKKALAGEIVATLNYEIRLKNNNSNKTTIEVIDQIPVSEESSVKTDIIEMTDGGEKDALTGKITWNIELNPGSEKILNLKYSVTYPKRRGFGLTKSYSKQRYRAKF